MIVHQDGSRSRYVHLSSVSVRVGDTVRAGQVIGRSGNTGDCRPRSFAHLHFARINTRWSSIPTRFLDVTSNNGVPVTGRNYTSDNYLTQLLLNYAVESFPTEDTEPPFGDVALRFTGELTHTVKLWAVDYFTDTIEMQLATSEADLESSSWQPYTSTVDWSYPAIFVQYRDPANNMTEVLSDTLDTVGYEPIQATFFVSPTVCQAELPTVVNLTEPLCEQCTWSWDWGHGFVSNQLDPYGIVDETNDHFTGYGEMGAYTVTLSVNN